MSRHRAFEFFLLSARLVLARQHGEENQQLQSCELVQPLLLVEVAHLAALAPEAGQVFSGS